MLYKSKNKSYPKFGELPVRPFDRVLEVIVVLILIALYVLYFTKESWIPDDVVLDKEMRISGLILLSIETVTIILVGISAYSLKWINFPIVIYEEAKQEQYIMISRMARECNVLTSLLFLILMLGVFFKDEMFVICAIGGLGVVFLLLVAIKSYTITRKGKAIAEMSK